MPRYIRPKITGATVFFTVCLADRRSEALTVHIAALRHAVAVTRLERPFAIKAWVVLRDHLHCVWQLPEGDANYSVRWGAIKARFSIHLRRAGFTPPPPIGFHKGGVNPALRRKGEIGLWQPRFWEHHIRDEYDLESHIAYCHNNPVKHGFVERPEDWPFSTIHRE